MKYDAGFVELIKKPNWFTKFRNRFCLFHRWFCRHGFQGLYYKGIPFVSDPSIPTGEIRFYTFNSVDMMAFDGSSKKSKKKTKKCKLCGHIKKFWNQKAPANPHCFPNLNCPNALKEDKRKMQEKKWKYYKRKNKLI